MEFSKLTSIKDQECDLIRKSCTLGDLEVLKYCISQLSVPLEDILSVLNSGLENSIKNNNNEIAFYLLSLKNVNPEISRNLPLRMSAKNNNEVLFKYLIENKNVDIMSRRNSVINHLAKNNNTDLLMYFLDKLEKNSNKNKKIIEKSIMALVIFACTEGSTELSIFALNVLKKQGIRLNTNMLINAIGILIKNGKNQLTELLLQSVKDIEDSVISALIRLSCEYNNIEMYKLLTKKYNGFPYGRKGKNFIQVFKNNNILFKELMLSDDNFDHSISANYALRISIERKNYDMVSLLLKKEKVVEGINEDFKRKINEDSLNLFIRFMNLENF